MPDKTLTLTLGKTEMLALLKVAETGLAVTEVLGLIPDSRTAERAVVALREAATR